MKGGAVNENLDICVSIHPESSNWKNVIRKEDIQSRRINSKLDGFSFNQESVPPETASKNNEMTLCLLSTCHIPQLIMKSLKDTNYIEMETRGKDLQQEKVLTICANAHF